MLSNFVCAAALQIRDNCFQQTSIAHYSQGHVRAIADVEYQIKLAKSAVLVIRGGSGNIGVSPPRSPRVNGP